MTTTLPDDLAGFADLAHQRAKALRAEIKAEAAARRSGHRLTAFALGQEAARSWMPRQCPDDGGPDPAGLCAAFLAGYDAARLEMSQRSQQAALRRNRTGKP